MGSSPRGAWGAPVNKPATRRSAVSSVALFFSLNHLYGASATSPGVCRRAYQRCGGGRNCCSGLRCVDGLCRTTGNVDAIRCGKPAVTCEAPDVCCGEICASLDHSQRHCGACFDPCRDPETCCGGRCTNLTSDRGNCGECGAPCPPGWDCCNGQCRAVEIDPDHCGACKQHCKSGQDCRRGQCRG